MRKKNRKEPMLRLNAVYEDATDLAMKQFIVSFSLIFE